MRFPLILLALLLYVGCSPANSRLPNVAEEAAAPESLEIKQVSVKVTGMMCPHSCLKDVKALICKQNKVESIELTPQKEADVIDNPVVLVRYRGELKKEETTQAILAAGFDNVEYVDE